MSPFTEYSYGRTHADRSVSYWSREAHRNGVAWMADVEFKRSNDRERKLARAEKRPEPAGRPFKDGEAWDQYSQIRSVAEACGYVGMEAHTQALGELWGHGYRTWQGDGIAGRIFEGDMLD